jgi:hypothetical protein
MKGGDLSRDKRVGGIVSNLWDPYLFVVMGSLPSHCPPKGPEAPLPPCGASSFFCAQLHACPIHSARSLGRASTAAAHTERSLPKFLRG